MKRLKLALKKGDFKFDKTHNGANWIYFAYRDDDPTILGRIEFTRMRQTEKETEIRINFVSIKEQYRNTKLMMYLFEEFIGFLKQNHKNQIVIDGDIVNRSLGQWLDKNRSRLESMYGVKFTAVFDEIGSEEYYEKMLLKKNSMRCEVKSMGQTLVMYISHFDEIMEKFPSRKFLKEYMQQKATEIIESNIDHIEYSIEDYCTEHQIDFDQDHINSLSEYLLYYSPKFSTTPQEESNRIGLIYTIQLPSQFQVGGD